MILDRILPMGLVLLGVTSLIVPAALIFGLDRGQAAFGDSEEIGLNSLSSATVDIEVGERSVTMTGDNLAPGDRTIGSIEVRNEGSLPLRYALVHEPSTDPLLGWISWELWSRDPSSGCDASGIGTDALFAGPLPESSDGDGNGPIIGDVTVGLDPGDRVLQPATTETICVVATFDLAAPDSLQRHRLVQEWTVVAEQHTDGLTR